MKHAQVEMIFDSLENKKLTLESLIRIEAEAKRLEEAMNSGRPATHNQSGYDNAESNNPYSPGYDDENNQDRHGTSESDDTSSNNNNEQPEVDPDAENPYASVYPTGAGAAALRASRQRSKRWSGPTKIFSAVSHTLHGIIDVDPEATRRNQIGKTKDAVVQVSFVVATVGVEGDGTSNSLCIHSWSKRCKSPARNLSTSLPIRKPISTVSRDKRSEIYETCLLLMQRFTSNIAKR
jgi:hypothetical protein